MYKTKIYQAIASGITAAQNCEANGNTEWFPRHKDKVEKIVKQFLPSGSGWDCGTKLDWTNSTGEKLVFFGSFHHMNEGGMYDGWTDHSITVRPSLQFGITISISGRNRNEIKEYMHETFEYALTREIGIEFDHKNDSWKFEQSGQ